MSKHSTPSQTILNLARAVNQLAKARERFRVASMGVEKAKCETLATRLLSEMETLTNPKESNPPIDPKVVAVYSEAELDEKCVCGHMRRMHLQGKCQVYGQQGTSVRCACQGFFLK